MNEYFDVIIIGSGAGGGTLALKLAGSGKSILASAFLVEGARAGETGVIAAFEQRSNSARGHALADLIAAGRRELLRLHIGHR